MNPVDKQLKRLTMEKHAGQGVMALSPLLLLDPSNMVINGIFALVFMGFGLVMWIVSEQSLVSLYSLYKVDLSIWYLLEKTESKITPQHCYQIIKNTNVALDYKLIPLIEEYRDENYMGFLTEVIEDRYSRIVYPISEEDVHWITKVLPPSLGFLTSKEKDVLDNKLKFYAY